MPQSSSYTPSSFPKKPLKGPKKINIIPKKGFIEKSKMVILKKQEGAELCQAQPAKHKLFGSNGAISLGLHC